ncbi:cytochrome P450 [Colletotrichum somersetense]|nr:cytochrome P450 [Colletotrichum somersetense]
MIIALDSSSFNVVQLVVALHVCLLSAGAIRALSRVIYNVYFHPLCAYPGPKFHAATGIPLSRMIASGKVHKSLADLHRKYGPVVRISPDTINWADPRALRDLMGHSKGGMENYRDPINAKFKPNSIINSNREDHARIRRVLAHGFSAQSMVEQQPIIKKHIDFLIQRLHENCSEGSRELNMVSWYNWTTFDIVGDLALGEPFGCLEKSDYHPWVAAIYDNVHADVYRTMLSRFWIGRLFLTWLVPKHLGEGQRLHEQLSQEKVRKRMALGESRPDFVQSMMMREGDLAMSQSEIEQTADTIIVVGSETTASVLSGATFFLLTHLEAMAELCKEVRASFKSEQEINILSVQNLQYMLAVLDESMRVYPVVPVGSSRIIKDGGDDICGGHVPGGTRVMVSQWPIFRNEEYFAQSNSFIPERWLGDDRFKADNRGALQPFSVGPRSCIGRNLALAEIRVILARIIWSFDMRIADDSRDWIDQELYGFWKKGPLHVFLAPRKKDE